MAASATILITGISKEEVQKKEKALQYQANNLTLLEIQRLEEMARSTKARAMLNENWSMLKSFI
jgi:hypothetical protein